MPPTFSSTVRLTRPPTPLPVQHPPHVWPHPSVAAQRPADQPRVLFDPRHAPVAVVAFPRPRETPAALYVLASFALMVVLAAAMSVLGSVATLAWLDASDEEPDDAIADTAPPSASLGR